MSDIPSDPPRDETPTEPGEAGDAPESGGSAWAGGDAAQRIAELEAELAGTRDRLLREVAEMDNLRKRTQREKDDAARFAISRFARDIVTVSDDLARALNALPEGAGEGDDELAKLVAGIELTERQLQLVFERHGVRRFDPSDEKFDPTVHEAMFEIPDPERPAGTVAQVVEVGYMIGDRVLRPARVGVSSGGPRAAPQPSPAGPEDPSGSAAAPPETPVAGPEAGTGPSDGPDVGRIGVKIDRSA